VTDPSRLGRIGLAGLALAAVIAALVSGGSPGTGRAEARDDARRTDLSRLADLALCIDREENGLPDVLGPHDICNPDPPLDDPFTGERYGYNLLSHESFRLCATFERPERMTQGYGPARRFDAQTGCLTVQRRDG